MSYLHKVVDFCSTADPGLADRPTVDGSVCPHFNIVFQNNDPGLDDFVVAAVILLCISEAVGSDLSAILKDHPVSDPAKLSHRDVRIGLEVVADARASINVDEGIERAVLSNLHIIFNDYIRCDGRVFTDSRRTGDTGRRVDSMRRLRWFIEKLNGAGKRQVRICASERGGFDFREI